MVIKGKVLISSNLLQSEPNVIFGALFYKPNILSETKVNRRLHGNFFFFFLSLIENRKGSRTSCRVHARNNTTISRKLIDGISKD